MGGTNQAKFFESNDDAIRISPTTHHMKPTLQTTQTRSRRDSVGTVRTGVRFPKSDCQFQAGPFGEYSGGGHGGKKRLPSFRGISEEYFDKEARGHFASEAGFFGLIVVTVAVPLFQVASVVVHWVQ